MAGKDCYRDNIVAVIGRVSIWTNQCVLRKLEIYMRNPVVYDC